MDEHYLLWCSSASDSDFAPFKTASKAENTLVIPLFPGALFQNIQCDFRSPPFLIGSVGCHGVKRICDSQYLGAQRDLFGLEMAGVPFPVRTFVVTMNILKRRAQEVEVLQDLCPGARVPGDLLDQVWTDFFVHGPRKDGPEILFFRYRAECRPIE